MPNSSTKVLSSGLYVPPGAASGGRDASRGEETGAVQAFIEKTMDDVEDYARREPWTFAAWVFGVGFVLGWKLKPW